MLQLSTQHLSRSHKGVVHSHNGVDYADGCQQIHDTDAQRNVVRTKHDKHHAGQEMNHDHLRRTQTNTQREILSKSEGTMVASGQ